MLLRKYTNNYPLLSRIVLYIFFFAVLLSVIITSLQLYLSFTREKQKVTNSLDQLEVTQLNTLVNNLWNLDHRAVEIQLNGILEHPNIVYIWLKHDDLDTGQVLTFGKQPPANNDILSKDYDLIRAVAGEDIKIGSVGFVADTDNIRSNLLRLSVNTISAEVISLAVTCFALLFLFVFLYSRHINRIVKYTKNLNVGKLDKELTLYRSNSHSKQPNEIDRIVDALNSMRLRLMNEIRAQQQAERNLIQEKLFSDVIIDSLPGIFFVLDEKLQLLKFNHSCACLFGLTKATARQYNFLSCIPAEQFAEVKEFFYYLLEHNRPISLEITLLDQNKQRTPYLLNARLLETEDMKYLIGIGSDLTEQKQLEGQLRQASKMEALGTLAGGVAHDFNNILTAIVGYTQLSLINSKDDQTLRTYLETIEKASERAQILVQQILSFSSKSEAIKQSLQLSTLIKEVLQLLRSSLPANITINQSIETDLFIMADPTSIHQVIVNLCTNAFHAMEDSGGILSVSLTKRIITEQDKFSEHVIIPGTYMVLTISDTGTGMEDKVKEKIFEPYFSTKSVGDGTGLGLAIVYGIVANLDGYIDVQSIVKQGTTFTVFLPSGTEVKQTAIKETQQGQEMVRGDGEKILVVDDEEIILDYYEGLLSQFGYMVTCISNSDDALAHFTAAPSAYDMIITDQVMPTLQGDELSRRIWEIRKDIPIIINSGYSKTISHNSSTEMGFAAYFQKPVPVALFLQTIKDNLKK